MFKATFKVEVSVVTIFVIKYEEGCFCSLVVKSRPALLQPQELQATRLLCHGFPRQEYWSCHSLLQGIFLTQGSNWTSPASSALAGRFFTSEPPGKPWSWEWCLKGRVPGEYYCWRCTKKSQVFYRLMPQLVLFSGFSVHQLLKLDFAKVWRRLINSYKTISTGDQAFWEGGAPLPSFKTSSYWSASSELYVNEKETNVAICIFREKKLSEEWRNSLSLHEEKVIVNTGFFFSFWPSSSYLWGFSLWF